MSSMTPDDFDVNFDDIFGQKRTLQSLVCLIRCTGWWRRCTMVIGENCDRMNCHMVRRVTDCCVLVWVGECNWTDSERQVVLWAYHKWKHYQFTSLRVCLSVCVCVCVCVCLEMLFISWQLIALSVSFCLLMIHSGGWHDFRCVCLSLLLQHVYIFHPWIHHVITYLLTVGRVWQDDVWGNAVLLKEANAISVELKKKVKKRSFVSSVHNEAERVNMQPLQCRRVCRFVSSVWPTFHSQLWCCTSSVVSTERSIHTTLSALLPACYNQPSPALC